MGKERNIVVLSKKTMKKIESLQKLMPYIDIDFGSIKDLIEYQKNEISSLKEENLKLSERVKELETKFSTLETNVTEKVRQENKEMAKSIKTYLWKGERINEEN